MKKTWLENYVLLMLRIDKIFKRNNDFFVDAYIGPKELKDVVEKEKIYIESELLKKVEELISKLNSLDFDNPREEYLRKHLNAVKTILHILDGKDISLKELVENILDIEYGWVDESHFKRGLDFFKKGLPGSGDLASRYQEWIHRNLYAFADRKEKVDYLNFIVKETKNRTHKIIDLPEKEDIDLKIVTDKRYGASTRYLGDLVSLVEINDDIPFNFFQLVPLITHELYPGHHTEFCIKEKHLVNDKNYFESNIFLLTSPQLVISEGLGEVAFDILFEPNEAAEWMSENIYKNFDIDIYDVNLEALVKASRHNSLDQISSNAAIMIAEGRKEKEVKDYIKKYTLQPDYMIDHTYSNLTSSVFKRVYAFTYYYGKRLVQNYLDKSEDRINSLNYIMKSQIYPSLLR